MCVFCGKKHLNCLIHIKNFKKTCVSVWRVPKGGRGKISPLGLRKIRKQGKIERKKEKRRRKREKKKEKGKEKQYFGKSI